MTAIHYFAIGMCLWSFIAGVIISTIIRQRNAARRTLETTERAYAELIKGSVDREQSLIKELRTASDKGDHAVEVWNSGAKRLRAAEADADRLAPIVREYVKMCDETAALLKDETPPALAAEREALRLHDEAVKARATPPHA